MNSTAVAWIIVVVLIYIMMCINNKIELMDAVTASFAVMLAAFGILYGVMAVLGIYSINKALAVELAASVLTALAMMLSGRKTGFLMKASEGYIKPIIRAVLLCVLVIMAEKVLTYAGIAAGQEDALSMAAKNLNQYLWGLIATALLLLVVADFVIRFAGYTKAQKFADLFFPIITAAAVAAGVFGVFLKASAGGTESVIYAAASLAAVAIAVFGLAGLYKKRDFIELLVLGICEYIMGYLLAAGILIGLNVFSIGRAVAGAVLLITLADVLIYGVRRKKPQVTFVWRRNLTGTLICLAVLPLSFSTFGMFGMGQDEGVYQAKAIGYIYGSNDNYFSFSEYDKIDSEAEKSEYLGNLSENLAGYNFALEEENVSGAGEGIVRNETLGNLHGVHTFSALLGLYGAIAGVGNMLQLGTWMLMISLFLLWLVLGNLGIHTAYKSAAMVLYAVSPQILWQARTSLVETTLALLILVFLYLITDKKNENYRWLSCFPIAVFSVFHITVYVFMPLFVLIYYGMYFATGKRRYMGAAIISIAVYLGGFYMMYASSLTYVYGNYDRLYIGGIGTDNIKEFVTAVCAGAVLLTIVLAAFPMKIRKKTAKKGKHKKKHGKLLWRIFVYILLGLGIAGCGYAALKTEYPFSYLTIYAYMLGSGIIFLPAVVLAACIKPDIFKRDSNIVILSAMFYYCVIIYSAFFKKEVLYYYYYGRYIVPYLAVIVILGGYVIQKLEDSFSGARRLQIKKNIQKISVFTALLIAALLLPYTAVVTTQQDETELQWDVLEEITDSIPEYAAVILSEELVPQLMMPLKYMTGADVYVPVQDTKAQYNRLKAQYSCVYFITGETAEQKLPEHMDSVYHNDNKIQTDVKMPEKLSGIKALIPYAEEFEVFWKPLTVYEYLSGS